MLIVLEELSIVQTTHSVDTKARANQAFIYLSVFNSTIAIPHEPYESIQLQYWINPMSPFGMTSFYVSLFNSTIAIPDKP